MHNMPMGKRGALLAISAIVVLLLAGCRPLWGPPEPTAADIQRERFDDYGMKIMIHMLSVPWNAAVDYFESHPEAESIPEEEQPEDLRGIYAIDRKLGVMKIDIEIRDVDIFGIYPELRDMDVVPYIRNLKIYAEIYKSGAGDVINLVFERPCYNPAEFPDEDPFRYGWTGGGYSVPWLTDEISLGFMERLDVSIPESPFPWDNETAGGERKNWPYHYGILDGFWDSLEEDGIR